jgi:hypothetical protein
MICGKAMEASVGLRPRRKVTFDVLQVNCSACSGTVHLHCIPGKSKFVLEFSNNNAEFFSKGRSCCTVDISSTPAR